MTEARSPDDASRASRRWILALPEDFGHSAAWVVTAVICAAYIAGIASLTSFPMQDYANHVARARIMADILFHDGAHFGRFFEVHLQLVPYVLPDLILMGLVDLLGPAVGAGVYTGMTLLSLPCALLFYAHVIGLPWRARLFVFLIGLYLSTDWFFLMGFLAFRLALALIVTHLAITELLRRRWSPQAYIAHTVVFVLGYLTHLSALLFMGVATGVSALVRLGFRTTTLRREVALLAPAAVLFAWYFGVAAPMHEGHGPWSYELTEPDLRRFAVTKIRNVLYEFVAFDWHVAIVTLLLFAACLFVPVRRELSVAALKKPAVVELLATAAAFLALYIVLPSEYLDVMYVDVRALPMVTLLLFLACLRLPGGAAAERAFGNVGIVGLAMLLAVVNLVYVMRPLGSNNAWIDRYRAVTTAIPADSFVLPVHTQTQRPHLIHIGSHVVLDRGAIIPYLFDGGSGAPMTYFRYKNRPYTPHLQWYKTQALGAGDPERGIVDWSRVACEYDFLLVTKPFDARFIRVPTTPVAANESAALLAVDRRVCRPISSERTG